MFKSLLLVVCLSVFGLFMGACGHPSVALGSTTIGGTSFNAIAEGSNAAGSTSTYAIVPAAGTTGITRIRAWIGVDSTPTATAVTAVLDPADGDYDADVLVPNPIPTGAKLWVEVTQNDMTNTGSFTLPAN